MLLRLKIVTSCDPVVLVLLEAWTIRTILLTLTTVSSRFLIRRRCLSVPWWWNLSCWCIMTWWRLTYIRSTLPRFTARGWLLISVMPPTAKPLRSGARWNSRVSMVPGLKLAPTLTISSALPRWLARLTVLETFLSPWPPIFLETCLSICLGLITNGSLAIMTVPPCVAMPLKRATDCAASALWLALHVLWTLPCLTTTLLFG